MWVIFFVQILDVKLVVSKNSIIKNHLQWASGNVQSGHGEVNNVGVCTLYVLKKVEAIAKNECLLIQCCQLLIYGLTES